jgi:CHAD domain-containing protein
LERTVLSEDIITVLVHHLEILLDEVKIYRTKVLLKEDAEDLHKFRIALRHSVVLMGEFSFLDESGKMEVHRKALKKLISLSNLKRDLDVFTLRLKVLQRRFPDKKKNYKYLFRHMKKIKKKAHRVFLAYLQSRECTDSLLSWSTYLESWQKEEDAIYIYASAKSVSAYVISLRLLKIKKQINALEKKRNRREERLHALRISYKKLRYLLETFASLFKKKRLKKCIKEIKKIQDILGTFHDSYRQRIILQDLLKHAKKKKIKDFIKTFLLPEIVRYQENEVSKIETRLEKFLKKENRWCFTGRDSR